VVGNAVIELLQQAAQSDLLMLDGLDEHAPDALEMIGERRVVSEIEPERQKIHAMADESVAAGTRPDCDWQANDDFVLPAQMLQEQIAAGQ
jgi:hypothetical protein